MHLCVVVKIDRWAVPAPGLMEGAGGAGGNLKETFTRRLEQLIFSMSGPMQTHPSDIHNGGEHHQLNPWTCTPNRWAVGGLWALRRSGQRGDEPSLGLLHPGLRHWCRCVEFQLSGRNYFNVSR